MVARLLISANVPSVVHVVVLLLSLFLLFFSWYCHLFSDKKLLVPKIGHHLGDAYMRVAYVGNRNLLPDDGSITSTHDKDIEKHERFGWLV